jgi:tRNA threonylcarbamoyladenosine biosynthesis protein TsaB
MLILALDTASPVCSACILDAAADRVLAEISEVIGTGHAERLMPMVEEVLAAAGVALTKIDLIACSVGPGSFTGVRVGVAAARGFAQGLGIPTVGVSTLEALAADALGQAGGRPVRVLIDARRGEVHMQDFSADGSPLSDPALMAVGDAGIGLDAFMAVGTGAPLVAPDAMSLLAEAATGAIVGFARIAAAKWRRGETSLTLSPLYLRGADAKPQEGFAIARREDA